MYYNLPPTSSIPSNTNATVVGFVWTTSTHSIIIVKYSLVLKLNWNMN